MSPQLLLDDKHCFHVRKQEHRNNILYAIFVQFKYLYSFATNKTKIVVIFHYSYFRNFFKDPHLDASGPHYSQGVWHERVPDPDGGEIFK